MATALSLEQVNDLRLRVLADEDVPYEELAAAVAPLRHERMSAKPQQKGKAQKTEVSLFDLSGAIEDQ